MSSKLIKNLNIVTFNEKFGYGLGNPYGQILGGWLYIEDGKYSAIGGPDNPIPKVNDSVCNTFDAAGVWITPSLIDCHTHIVYAGNRSNEFEMLLNGASYEDIAKSGGGILSTVKSVREASFDQLYKESEARLTQMTEYGVRAVEIKSGYGLNLESERKMLQVARQLSESHEILVQKTYLAAHALPPEYKNCEDEYINKVCEWMEILNDEGLIDAVDGFMENIAFNQNQIKKVFDKAKELDLPVKLHAEQLSNMEGSALCAAYGGLSCDHIEHLSNAGVEAMAASGTVGVLLPSAFYNLKDTQKPPIDSLRKSRVPLAVSTDCNPGTSPNLSLPTSMNMACVLFGLTPEEALAGATINAAKALGWSDMGKIDIGLSANYIIWDIERPADISYMMGIKPRSDSFATIE